MTTRYDPRNRVPALLVCLVTAVAAAIALAPARSSADCCTGPPVAVVLKHWTPLTTSLKPTVRSDDPDHTFRATISAHLKVGSHLVARLNSVTVTNVTPSTPARVTFKVSERQRDAAARYGARTHHRHGTITFVIRATDQATGEPAFPRTPYGQDAYVTLPRVHR